MAGLLDWAGLLALFCNRVLWEESQAVTSDYMVLLAELCV